MLEGLIREGEGEQLAVLARRAVAPIVEVGSYKGMSAVYLARGDQPVHCVDPWDLGGQKHANKYADPDVFAAFQAQIKAAGVAGKVTAHKGTSAQIAASWDGPVGLLHIDGLHTYDGVRSDLADWAPFLVDGATVAFHDYCPDFDGVRRAVDEWAGRGRIVHRLDRLAWVDL